MLTRSIARTATVAFALAMATSSPAQWLDIGTYPLPENNTGPTGITQGPDGAIWFCEGYGTSGAIVRMTADGAMTTYPLPDPDGEPIGITSGPDGALWFTNQLDDKIGRITTAGVITEYSLPGGAGPQAITKGPDGALWFTEFFRNRIARITTAGSVTEFSTLPTAASAPVGITTGPDGALWFAEFGANKIGRMTTLGVLTEYPVPTPASNPSQIAVGPDGALWFTYQSVSKIGRITTAGVFTEFPLPRFGGFALGITAGRDGAIWFSGSEIGRVTMDGLVTEYALPSSMERANNIAAGPAGQLWFTADLNYLVGHAPTCGLALSISLAGATLTMNFEVGTTVPATLNAWHFSVNGANQVFSQSFNGMSTPVPVVDSINVNPNLGIQGIEAVMMSTSNHPLCAQGAFVNTGGAGPTLSQLQQVIAASGLVPQP